MYIQGNHPQKKKSKREAESLQLAIEASTITALEEEEKFKFLCFDDFRNKLGYVTLPQNWNIIVKSCSVIFMYLNLDKTVHDIIYIIVNDDLKVSIFLKGVEMKIKDIPNSVKNVLELDNIVRICDNFLKEEDNSKLVTDAILNLIDLLPIKESNAKIIHFIKSQIKLCSESKERHRFNSETMVISSMLLFISPHAYKFLRNTGIIVLPHPNTIKNLCSNISVDPSSSNFLSYITQKINYLQPHDFYVTLMLDEIHIKPYVDYKGGNIMGMAYDSLKVATTAHVFMIKSLLSSFKDVIHILPVNKMDANKLFEILKNVVMGLENSNFKVVAIVTDNNKINSKAVSFFAQFVRGSTDIPNNLQTSQTYNALEKLNTNAIKTKKIKPLRSIVYPHPANKCRPLFYLNDSVHIIKCIRNNWLNLKNCHLTFCFPDFDDFSVVRYASFAAVRDMYKLESEKLLKFGHGISLKALWPSTFERQNVMLVLQIFSDAVKNGLLELGPTNNIVNYEDTAKFINIIKTWWDVVNVKTPSKGIRLKNEMQKPLTNKPSDDRYKFLNKFLDWIDKWEALPEGGKLTKETQDALKYTTYALIEITDFCINELNFSYILPGKIQTDSLEERFGRYRQLSGSQYHVSIRQIFESEKKLRLLSFLELPLKSNSDYKIVINKVDNDWGSVYLHDQGQISNIKDFESIHISDTDLRNVETDMPVLTYIAGYCCHSLIKHFKCDNCKDYLTVDREMASDITNRLILQNDRGGLRFPSEFPVMIVTYTFVTLQKLLSNETFLKNQNQRTYACAIVVDAISDFDIFSDAYCEEHSKFEISKRIIFITCNIILNNFCKLTNNSIAENSKPNSKSHLKRKKNRKLETVSNKSNKI